MKKIAPILLIALSPFYFLCSSENYEQKRQQMVAYDIKGRGIKDKKVLEAMGKVPRHEFVSSIYRSQAYGDHPLPIGEGQTISQPYIVALMTESLELKPGDRVLEIGTGSGYQAAVLAEIAKEVYTIEIVESLADRATKLLQRLGYKNIKVKAGDGYFGWKEHAPFDAVIITAAANRLPKPLIEQLKEGGRMIMPLGRTLYYQDLVLFRKKGNKIKKEELIPVRFVPMTGEVRK